MIETRVLDYMQQYYMIKAGQKVLVGVSGGADSVCLLFLLLQMQEKLHFSVEAMHVNHQIRKEEAKRDQEFVVNLCQSLQVPCKVVSVDVPERAKKEGLSLEEAGRLARYEAFAREADTNHAIAAVAHHRDDEDETMLLHLFRGCGLRGLSGMKPVQSLSTEYGKLSVIRPLLCISRAEIEEYLSKRGIAFVTDTTNLMTDGARNHLRLSVLPYIKKNISSDLSGILHRERELFEQTDDYMIKQAEAFLADRTNAGGEDGIYWIAVRALTELHPALQEYVIREMLERVCKMCTDVFRVHVDAVIDLTSKQSGRWLQLPNHIKVLREFDRLVFGMDTVKELPLTGRKESQRSQEEDAKSRERSLDSLSVTDWQLSIREFAISPDFLEKNSRRIYNSPYTKWLDCDKIKGTLLLRTRRPGDYLTINAKGNTKKLQDYMVEKKIPLQLRKTWPVVADGNVIVWVYGFRISDTYKVTEHTKRVMELTLLPITKDKEGDTT